MMNTKKVIEELDLSQLIKVLISGMWIILTFTILGLLISYVYQKDIISAKGEIQYKIKIPVYELGTVDNLKLNELNFRIRELYLAQGERSLLESQPVFKNSIMLSQFDSLVSSRISGIINWQNLQSYTEDNDFTSKEIMSMLFQITKRESFILDIISQYNFFIENKYRGNEEKINNNKLNIIPIIEGVISEVGGFQKYDLTFKFIGDISFDNEMPNEFAKQALLLIRHELNQQLYERYKIAENNYYQVVNYIKDDLSYLIKQLENEFEISLKSKIHNLEEERDIAISLGYNKPQKNVDNSSTVSDIYIGIDNFSKGWIYLDKRILYYEEKLNEDYSNFIPELRFYKNALLEIGKYMTLETTQKRISELGLFENKMKVFHSSVLDTENYQKNNLNSSVTVQKTIHKNLYAVPFGALIGLAIGIFLTFLNYFYRNRASL